MVHGFQKFDILPGPAPGIRREEDIARNRNGIGACLNDLCGAFQLNPPDGHNRLVRQRPHPANQFDAHHWIWAGLRGRGKHWPYGDGVSGRGGGFPELLQVVRRNTQ